MSEKPPTKLYPHAQRLFHVVMDELTEQDSSKTNGVYEEDFFSDEDKYHILRYLTNMLESEEAELYKKIK
jgi:hypothetical protein